MRYLIIVIVCAVLAFLLVRVAHGATLKPSVKSVKVKPTPKPSATLPVVVQQSTPPSAKVAARIALHAKMLDDCQKQNEKLASLKRPLLKCQ